MPSPIERAPVLSGEKLLHARRTATSSSRRPLTIGPNVFVDGTSDNAHAEAGPHQRWATAVLWDNITVHGNNNDIQNAGNYGTGHGWEGASCVIWNNAASGFIVQNPPGAHNWLIGSVGPIQNGTRVEHRLHQHAARARRLRFVRLRRNERLSR